jgi:hypothetical protein
MSWISSIGTQIAATAPSAVAKIEAVKKSEMLLQSICWGHRVIPSCIEPKIPCRWRKTE